ncbi:unnamed protein product, partial [Onchocerca ochengi]|uniref:Clp R domain-containing protein n=1 Tax=Onchocerca ochengi TaxID=42157 RepID=A0A182DY66_ONCOC
MLLRQIREQTYGELVTTFPIEFIRTTKKYLNGTSLILFAIMVSLMIAQLKNTEQKQMIVIEKICPKEFLLCLLIKDETFGDRQDLVLRTLVPEKFPDFVIAQIILQTVTGWKSWLSTVNRIHCHAMALLPSDYQQIMLTASYLTESLSEMDSGVGYSHVLLIGLGARSIANYIHHNLFR